MYYYHISTEHHSLARSLFPALFICPSAAPSHPSLPHSLFSPSLTAPPPPLSMERESESIKANGEMGNEQ